PYLRWAVHLLRPAERVLLPRKGGHSSGYPAGHRPRGSSLCTAVWPVRPKRKIENRRGQKFVGKIRSCARKARSPRSLRVKWAGPKSAGKSDSPQKRALRVDSTLKRRVERVSASLGLAPATGAAATLWLN